MGVKYMAQCAKYPHTGYWTHSIQEKHILPFVIKLIKAIRKYEIINIQYRNC